MARERTVGDLVTAAVRQGRKLDFRFRPLTAAERRQGSKRTGAAAFGPILEQLGLLTEAEMAQVKGKRTRAELVRELTLARIEIAGLRERVQDLEREMPLADRIDAAASLLAEQLAATIAARCSSDEGKQQDENQANAERMLRLVARGHRLAIVVAHQSALTGEECIARGVVGAMGDPLDAIDFCLRMDEVREINARHVVTRFGAADSLALARRCGAEDKVIPGKKIPL